MAEALRALEALLFAAPEPLDAPTLARLLRLDDAAALEPLLTALAARLEGGGLVLVSAGGRWALRTAPDLAAVVARLARPARRLSRAAVETLTVIAYCQPVTRAEIEEIRGVALGRGTLDQLIEAGLVKAGRRRAVPGRPLTWVTTPAFLDHFGLGDLEALPGAADMRASGLTDPAALGRFRDLPAALADPEEA